LTKLVPYQPFYKQRYVKVYEETLFHICQFHIRQYLRLVDCLELLDTFEFENDFIFDQDVYPVSAIQTATLIVYR